MVQRLLEDGDIEVEPDRVSELELSLSSFMREQLRNEQEVNRAAREALEQRGLDLNDFRQLRREMAAVGGFRLGDEGVADVIDRMVRWLSTSQSVSTGFAADEGVRQKILAVFKQHLERIHARGRDLRSTQSSRRLVMTPELKQALRFLQLSLRELVAEVEWMVEQNSVLELADKFEGERSEPAPRYASSEAAQMEFWSENVAEDPETAKDVNDSGGAHGLDRDSDSNRSQSSMVTDQPPSFEVDKKSFRAHLMQQLGLLGLDERRIARAIIENLDGDGCLRMPSMEGDPLIRLANEVNVDAGVAERTLRKIQRLDPRGCGGRDLRESCSFRWRRSTTRARHCSARWSSAISRGWCVASASRPRGASTRSSISSPPST